MQPRPMATDNLTSTAPSTPVWLRTGRFFWRAARNAACMVPMGRQIIYPSGKLAERFGPAEIAYGMSVFEGHWKRLKASGFQAAENILEVGPGRNLTTAILMWAASATASGSRNVRLTLWDVFANMAVTPQAIMETAAAILNATQADRKSLDSYVDPELLHDLASGAEEADIRYCVAPMREFWGKADTEPDWGAYDLIYSQAAIEHIWFIKEFWAHACKATRAGGWHSHRIDLADHGRRETNYIEMLEYSELAYWLSQRFVPGATNRLRASEHVRAMIGGGLYILIDERHLRDKLPVPRGSLAYPFAVMDEEELRCTAIDVVGRKPNGNARGK
jgi:hypothetical protein